MIRASGVTHVHGGVAHAFGANRRIFFRDSSRKFKMLREDIIWGD